MRGRQEGVLLLEILRAMARHIPEQTPRFIIQVVAHDHGFESLLDGEAIQQLGRAGASD